MAHHIDSIAEISVQLCHTIAVPRNLPYPAEHVLRRVLAALGSSEILVQVAYYL